MKLEYTQNILLPQLDPAVRFDPGDPSTHDPFMRTRGVAAPMVVGDRVAVTNKDGSVTYHRIPNDPMQAPYMGQFRTGRALDEGQWIARDNTFFTVVKTFTEQAALYKAELSCYEKIHSIDEVMCDGKSFLLSRILEEAFPEPNEEEAQLVLEQYEASNVFNPAYYFSDFITYQVELNVRLKKLSTDAVNHAKTEEQLYDKVTTIFKAVFTTKTSGDALTDEMYNFAKLLRRKHSRDLTDEERGYIADLTSVKNRIKQLEVQTSKQCTRRPRDASMQVKEYDSQPPPKVVKDRLHLLDVHDDLGGMTVSELEALHATVDEELEARFDGSPLQRKALASGYRPTDRVSRDTNRRPPGPRFFGHGRGPFDKSHVPDLGYHSKPTGMHPSVARGGVNGRSARGTPPVRNARKEATHRHSDRKRPDRPGLDSRRTSLVNKSDKPSGDDRKPSARPTVAQDFQRKVDLTKRFVGMPARAI